MNEAQWLGCSSPCAMLNFIGRWAGTRRPLLFVCACERLLWGWPSHERARVDLLERYADDPGSEAELLATSADVFIYGATLRAITGMDAVAYALGCSDAVAVEASWLRHEHQVDEGMIETVPYWSAAYHQERAAQADLLRDIFGNPFRSVDIKPAWKTPEVLALGEGIYEDGAWERMPILGDALEEAGCTGSALAHCRSPGLHVRGCWLLDAIRSID